jgi:hypothetical protein
MVMLGFEKTIMTNETTTPENQQLNLWKQVFETAVDELGGRNDAKLARKMPIAKRIRIARPPADAVTAQKRALTDAAAALSALWKRPEKKMENGAIRPAEDNTTSGSIQPRLQRAHSF